MRECLEYERNRKKRFLAVKELYDWSHLEINRIVVMRYSVGPSKHKE